MKRIIRYVNGTLDYGLWYPYDTSLIIARYSYADWVGNVEDRKSTLGEYVSLLGIVWFLG